MADSMNKILFKLFGDSKDLDKTLRKTQGNFKKTGKSAGKMETAFNSIKGAVAGLGVAFGARELLRFTGDAVQMAIAAEEVDSKFQAVYGSAQELTGALSDWGDMAGVTDTAARDMAATFGNLAMAQGVSADETEKMVLDVATLAGDMASFNDSDPQQVFDDLNKALLTTEREGMKKYGIAITESEVKQRALDIAIADGRSEANQADRAYASYAIAVEQAGKAVGDLERTQDSLANKQRQMLATFEEAQEAFGRPLVMELQLLTKTIDTSGDSISDMAGRAGDAVVDFGALSETFANLTVLTDDETSAVDKLKGGFNLFAEAMTGPISALTGWGDGLRFNIEQAADATDGVNALQEAIDNAPTGMPGDVPGDLADLEQEARDAADAVYDLDDAVRTFSGDLFGDYRKERAVAPLLEGGGGQEFATGGVVPGQRGQAQLAVVHGGERVLTPMQQQQGGGTTVIVNMGVVGDPVEAAAQIEDLLTLYGRSNGIR